MTSGGESSRRRRSYSRGTADASRRRRFQYGVRVSEAERAGLEERAAARGVSVAALMVDAALGRADLQRSRASVAERDRAVIDGVLAELGEVRAELGRVGNNLNQMAHGVNITRELPAARRLEEALAEHRALTSQLMRVGVRLARWSRGLPDLRAWAPEGEDEGDEGSEEWWARRVESHRAYTDEVPREAYEGE